LPVTPIVTTALSSVDADAAVLRLRGFSIDDLIAHGIAYADVVDLLLSGELGGSVEERLVALPLVPAEAGDPFVALRRSMALVRGDDDVAVAGLCGRLVGSLSGNAEHAGSYVERILRGVSTGDVDDDDVIALDRCFVVHLDHALNPGTLCVRVAASTGASLSACLTAGLCALEGPLHGGASSAVGRVLEQELRGPDDVDGWLLSQQAQQKRVPGFGHPIYRHRDPRAAILRSLVERTAERRRQHRFVDTAIKLEERVRATSEGKLFPNVDFYAAALYATLGVPLALHTALFFSARVLGWTAHVQEQRRRGKTISPEADYDGPPARSLPQGSTR
jgi:citrate synthase